MALSSAYELLEKSLIHYKGEPVGTAAACDDRVVAANYHECFVRDFVPSALVFLMNGRSEIVRNFLLTVMRLRGQQRVMKGHKLSMGLMPASFHVTAEDGQEHIVGDFGDRAIGRVTPVDSAMWWVILLRAYVVTTDDWELVESEEIQQCISQILELYLRERFESS
ncbi:glycoside hydrolase 100 family protein, partial [Kaarinaea lacus]